MSIENLQAEIASLKLEVTNLRLTIEGYLKPKSHMNKGYMSTDSLIAT
jgi:ribosomal protein L29